MIPFAVIRVSTNRRVDGVKVDYGSFSIEIIKTETGSNCFRQQSEVRREVTFLILTVLLHNSL